MSKKQTHKLGKLSNASSKVSQNRFSHKYSHPLPLLLSLLPKYFNPFQQLDHQQLIDSYLHDQKGKMKNKLLLNELDMLNGQQELIKRYLEMGSIKKEIKAVVINRIQTDKIEPIHYAGETYRTMKPKNQTVSSGLIKTTQSKKSKQLSCSLKLLQNIPSFAPFPQNLIKARINPEYGGLKVKENCQLKENKVIKRKEGSYRRMHTEEEKRKARISLKKNKEKCTKLSKSQLKLARF